MSFIDDIGNFFLGVTRIVQDIENLISDVEQLFENTRLELHRIKQLEVNPKWKTRVINVPAAFDQTKGFLEGIVDEVVSAFHSLVSNLRAIRREIHIEPEPGGQKTLAIIHILEKIRDFVTETDAGIRALESFVDAIRQSREELESFETVFLQQGNLRRVERLEDGTKIKIRLGSLHS